MRMNRLSGFALAATLTTGLFVVGAQARPVADQAVEYLDDMGFVQSGVRCGAYQPTVEEVEYFEAETQQLLQNLVLAPEASGTVNIPIAFHVITKNGEGNVPQSMLDEQLNVLNAAYANSPYRFYQGSLDYTENATWFDAKPDTTAEQSMKSSLAIDPAHNLNFYTTSGGGYLGWATFPSYYDESDTRHGVVILHSSLPGGASAPYDEGDTATHEIGHFLGLYHTFQGGCSGGDQVSDTNPEKDPVFGCPSSNTSCSTPDPIHNYMDYTDDVCMYEFTSGQIYRMMDQVSVYRPSLGQ